MRRLIFILITALLFSSCAEKGQQKIMRVEEYHFSIQTPPSSWKQMDIKKEMERGYQQQIRRLQVPAGQKAFIKKMMSDKLARQAQQYEGFFAWKRGNDSSIMVAAKEHTELSKQKTYKEILDSQINNRLDILLNDYQEATEIIDTKNEGIFKEGIEYASIEATINCFDDAGKLRYTEKMISYALNTDSHIYFFSLATIPNKFENYRLEFEEVINSFSYTKPDSIKENKIVKPPVEYKGFVGKKKGDNKEGEPCLNSGECGRLLYCIEHKCQKYSEKSPDLQKKCPEGYYFHEDWHSGKCFPEKITCPEGYHYDKDKKKCSSDN